jgi:DNA-binding transcriptional regulator YhcF (GntR family)
MYQIIFPSILKKKVTFAVMKIIQILKIDELSATPKYQQLVNLVLDAVQKGVLKQGDSMPSINEMSAMYDISRVTVEKGYNLLRQQGVLAAFHGKGYFIAGTKVSQELKIFLMFNKLSAHKKLIYDAFVETLGDKAAIDFFIYNNNAALFSRLLGRKKESNYSHYVIIPHFIEGENNAYQLIDALPKQKLILLDKNIPTLSGEYGAVYEHFAQDIFQALSQALEPLQKYHTLKLIFPENSYHSKEIIEGFTAFCQNFAYHYKIVANILQEPIQKGEVYINLMEDDLVLLLEKIMDLNLQIGSEVGIISYNETKVKKFIMNGLTTISTDFRAMGVAAATLVLNNSKEKIKNPFLLRLRGSV